MNEKMIAIEKALTEAENKDGTSALRETYENLFLDSKKSELKNLYKVLDIKVWEAHANGNPLEKTYRQFKSELYDWVLDNMSYEELDEFFSN